VTAYDRADQHAEPGLTPMTLAEVRRLLNRLTSASVRSMAFVLHGSRWRRRHQARARISHYQRQSSHEK